MTSVRKTTAATAAALAVGSATLASAGCTPPTPTCQSSQLIARFERGEGAAGSLYETWQLVNTGGTCQLNGWVNALNLDSGGHPLPTSVTDELDAHTAVVLNHGQVASWFFHYGNPGILGCSPENPAGMLITPPGNTTPIRVYRGIPACNGSFGVSPLQAGG